MPFSDEERALLMNTPMVGKTIIKRLEHIGADNFESLREASASLLCEHIADQCGIRGWASHSMALQSVQNAIDTAKNAS